MGGEVCGFGGLGTSLWGTGDVDMGRAYPSMGFQTGNGLGSHLWDRLQVAVYGALPGNAERREALRSCLGSRLWYRRKVAVYGHQFGARDGIEGRTRGVVSHKQVPLTRKVTFYGNAVR